MDNTNVEIARLLPQDEVDIAPSGKEMRVKSRSGTAFEIVFKCNEDDRVLIFTEGSGYKWVGCCPPGTKLKGDDSTAFDCCMGGENVTGCSATKKYGCCPSGYVFDGNDCARIDENHPCHPPPPCPSGQARGLGGRCEDMECEPGQSVNSDGVCECPPGTEFSMNDGTCRTKCPAGSTPKDDGTCGTPPCPDGQEYEFFAEKCVDTCPRGLRRCWGPDPMCCPSCPAGEVLDEESDECKCTTGTERSYITRRCEKPGCPSGLQTGKPTRASSKLYNADINAGKCYTLTFENGYPFGYDPTHGFYDASASHPFGKFQICTNEICTPGVDIEAGTYFNLQEITGPAPPTSSQRNRTFVNNAEDSAYMTRTDDFWESGGFVITRWPDKQYCLGGYRYDNGVGSGTGVGTKRQAGGLLATFLNDDDQACVVVTVTEIPCDIRAPEANCIGGNKIGSSASSSDGSGVAGLDLAFNFGDQGVIKGAVS